MLALGKLLELTLAGREPAEKTQLTVEGVRMRWLSEGALEVKPPQARDNGQDLLLSAGIHGNETAPIELLDRLLHDIARGDLPEECRGNERVWQYLQSLTGSGGVIGEVKVFDLKQSMQNGGGPACLRLRVALNETELAAVNPGVIMTAPLYDSLTQWVERHYRDRMTENDLVDPQLLLECRAALDELTQILKLGAVYPFQIN